MNQRLEDLMYQAGLTAQGSWDSMDPYDQQAIERFAELIVKECLEICKEKEQANLYGVREVENTIKEHFGVES